jgi:two-component system chemotaxis response regulator CheY
MRILIVEDDTICRMSLKDELDHYGDCHAVGNGAAALRAYVDAALGRKPFDVIFMDLQMPVMDGLTAIDKIREYEAEHLQHIPRPAKIVVATGVEELQSIVSDFQRQGVVACMKKPLRQKALKTTMASINGEPEAAPADSGKRAGAGEPRKPGRKPAGKK